MNRDRVAKQKFNIILLVDTSRSMQGSRIDQVNQAISDISKYLKDMQIENTNVDFYISILTFATEAKWVNSQKETYINNFKFDEIKAFGQSNLHLAYHELNDVLRKESQGGMMPDFGGVAPVILLLTDGHPSKGNLKEELELLRSKPWFKVALKYGVAIELNDDKTIKVLKDFVSGNGDVIQVYNSNLLNKIIKIIIMTASKVKSTSNSVHNTKYQSVTNQVQQEIQEALADIEDWEW